MLLSIPFYLLINIFVGDNMDIKKLFNEIEKHLLEDEKPSLYLNKIKDQGLLVVMEL